MRKLALWGIGLSYLYVIYLSITLFLIPAFTAFFALYGVLGTFGIWFGLTAAGYACGYFFAVVLGWPRPQATYRESDNA